MTQIYSLRQKCRSPTRAESRTTLFASACLLTCLAFSTKTEQSKHGKWTTIANFYQEFNKNNVMCCFAGCQCKFHRCQGLSTETKSDTFRCWWLWVWRSISVRTSDPGMGSDRWHGCERNENDTVLHDISVLYSEQSRSSHRWVSDRRLISDCMFSVFCGIERKRETCMYIVCGITLTDANQHTAVIPLSNMLPSNHRNMYILPPPVVPPVSNPKTNTKFCKQLHSKIFSSNFSILSAEHREF